MTSVQSASNALKDPIEPSYTTAELAELTGVTQKTIRKWFVDEPGVLRLGHSYTRNKRPRYIMRIPVSVASAFFERMKVGHGGRA